MMEFRWVDWVALGVGMLAALLFDNRNPISAKLQRILGGSRRSDPAYEQTALLAGIKSLMQEQADWAKKDQGKILAEEWRMAVEEQGSAAREIVLRLQSLEAMAVAARREMGEQNKDSFSLLAQVRDHIGSLRTTEEDTKQAAAQTNLLGQIRDNTSSDPASQAHGIVLGKILEQLEKNDQRLADFVGATRRIMRALEGNSETDEDTQLFEEAKLIQERAAAKGVILTAEDSLKRAREQRNFSMAGR